MGSWWSNLFKKPDSRIIMIGLDNAGKTTILYKMKLNETVSTHPTIGFNVETVKYKNISMNIWDLGGQHKIRRLWHHYFEQCDGIIFVIDSTDIERLKDDKSTETVDHEIKYLTTVNSLKGVPILFLANKYDCSKAKTAHEITKILNLSSLTNRKWYCLSTSALSGDGIYEGIDWLANMINDRH